MYLIRPCTHPTTHRLPCWFPWNVFLPSPWFAFFRFLKGPQSPVIPPPPPHLLPSLIATPHLSLSPLCCLCLGLLYALPLPGMLPACPAQGTLPRLAPWQPSLLPLSSTQPLRDRGPEDGLPGCTDFPAGPAFSGPYSSFSGEPTTSCGYIISGYLSPLECKAPEEQETHALFSVIFPVGSQ